MYSKIYYAEKIRPIVEERIKAMDHSPTKGELLALRKVVTREKFKNEAVEVRSKIDAAYKAQNERTSQKLTESQANNSTHTERSPSEYQK